MKASVRKWRLTMEVAQSVDNHRRPVIEAAAIERLLVQSGNEVRSCIVEVIEVTEDKGAHAMSDNAFRDELEALINRHSKENGSNSPDHILAMFLAQCLEAFDAAVNMRERWYGREPSTLEKIQSS